MAGPLARRIWSRTSNAIIRVALGVPMHDFTNGYRLYSRRAVELLASAKLRETGYITLSEWAYTIHRSGLTIAEVPTVFINRRLGESNMSASEAIGAIRALLACAGGSREPGADVKALITGVTGQDGSYLAEFLLERDYEVFGLVRSTSLGTFERIEHLLDRITVLEGDMLDEGSLIRALKASQPDEVYNLAAHSFVQRSFGQPVFTADVTGLGVARILEAIRETTPSVRFYQASSSEMFGNTNESFQNEDTRFVPASPYAVAKVFAHQLTQNYRRAYGLYASCGILFNHESPRRGLHFVTRKVTDGAARISLGMADNLKLGNLEARRDWGFAGDYVRAMWLMLQQHKPGDFVIATGVNHSVRDLCELAFGLLNLDYRDYVEVDPANIRPSDVPDLRGDASRAREALGWTPTVGFEDLIRTMVEADVERLRASTATAGQPA